MPRINRAFCIAAGTLALATAATAAPVSFFKNVLDTSFPSTAFPNVRYPVEVHAADMDGDTDLDLVVSVAHFAGTGEGIYWYQNDGAFAFTKTLIDTMLIDADLDGVRFDVADIDDDLDLDIVLVGANRLYLYTNDGGGVFTRRIIESTLGALRKAAVADLDGDLDEDVALLSNNGLYWAQNDGSENFTAYPIQANPVVDQALEVVDLDGDSDQDIIASVVDVPTGNRWLTWYETLPGGSFLYHIFDVLQDTEDVADVFVADVDEDGLLDIVVAKSDDDDVWWYEDMGGNFYVPRIVTSAFNDNPRHVWVSDIDNDADRDVIVAGGNVGVGEISYFENDGTQAFTHRSIDVTTGSRQGLFVVDLDGDTLDDLLVTDLTPNELIWYNNLGTGTPVARPTFAARVELHPNVPNPFNPSTTIGFDVSPSGEVTVDVFAVDGSKVRSLLRATVHEGYHEIRWDGRDDRGRGLASGVYLVRLATARGASERKVVLLK